MNILILTSVYYPDVIGGGEISTQLVAENLVLRGHHVYVFALSMKNKDEMLNGVYVMRRYIPKLSEEYMAIIKNGNPFLIRLSSVYKIVHKYVDIFYSKEWYTFYKKLYTERHYDLIHSVSSLSYTGRYNAWKAAYDLKIPISHVARSPELLEFQFLNGKLNYIYRKLNARSATMLAALAAPSKYMLDCHKKCGIKARYNVVIFNAVGMASKEKRKFIPYSTKKNFVLFAGDIREEKGVLTLYKAISKIENVKLEMVGTGKLYEYFTNRKNVITTGWLPQKELYLKMQYSKVVVLPSEWNEAFGRVLIEAIANGTIAIGSSMGGIPEVLQFDMRYIFEAGNVIELHDKIYRILNLDEYEYEKEVQDQQKWLDNYTLDIYTDRWENFFLNQIEG